MSRNDIYTTGHLLDYLHYQNYCKGIDLDLSTQANTIIPQETNFVGKLEEDHDVAMFVASDKWEKTILNFSLDSLIVTE